MADMACILIMTSDLFTMKVHGGVTHHLIFRLNQFAKCLQLIIILQTQFISMKNVLSFHFLNEFV